MRKLFTLVVNNPKKITIAFGVLLVACLIMWQFVGVNYNLFDYLAADSPSTMAIDTMEEEYSGGIPNARVMVEDVTVAEALEVKNSIALVPGVESVTWLDDEISIVQPVEFMDETIRDSYYVDNNALFTVTINENTMVSAVNEIRDIIGEKGHMTGNAVSIAVATEGTVVEIAKIAAAGIGFCLLILLLTMQTWAEPFIILIGLGVAVGINAGTNIVLGDISFVTNASGSILQLAVSLDYSVFILHRFAEYRREYDDVRAAMLEALCKSTSSVLSSGLTTVLGFLALCLMKFRLGPDLGIALAKGVGLSLVTAFIFLPAVILLTYRLIDKTKHRSFIPSFEKVGKLSGKIMVPAVIIFAILIVPTFLASNGNSFYFGASHIYGEGTELGADTALIEDTFNQCDTYVLMVDKKSTARQAELSDELKGLPEVMSIVSYVDTVGSTIPTTYLDSGTLSKLNSENYTRMVITVDAAAEGEETFALVEKIREIAEEYYPGAWLLAGEGVSTTDLMSSVTSDLVKVNLLAVLAILIVLIFATQSAILPVLLVIGIETAIWINVAIPYFTGSYVFYIAYLMISSIQLGATVDYAILYTDRYREFRAQMSRKKAIVATTDAVAVSILTSGSVLTVIGFLMGFFTTHGLISQLGFFLGIGTIFSMLIVFFVIPGLLYFFERPIRRFTRNFVYMDEVSGEICVSNPVNEKKSLFRKKTAVVENEPVAELQSESVAEAEVETEELDPVTEEETGPEAETGSELEIDLEPVPEAEPELETGPEEKMEQAMEADSDPESETEPGTEADEEIEPEHEAESKQDEEPESEKKPEAYYDPDCAFFEGQTSVDDYMKFDDGKRPVDRSYFDWKLPSGEEGKK